MNYTKQSARSWTENRGVHSATTADNHGLFHDVARSRRVRRHSAPSKCPLTDSLYDDIELSDREYLWVDCNGCKHSSGHSVQTRSQTNKPPVSS